MTQVRLFLISTVSQAFRLRRFLASRSVFSCLSAGLTVLAFTGLLALPLDAVAQNSVTVPLGGTSQTQTTSTILTTQGTVSEIDLLTEGNNSEDFTLAGYGCLIGTTYPAGHSCGVAYTFTPRSTGVRRGSFVIKAADGTILGTGYLNGIGTGSQAAYFPSDNYTNIVPAITAPYQVNLHGPFFSDGDNNLYYSTDGITLSDGTTFDYLYKGNTQVGNFESYSPNNYGYQNGHLTGIASDALGNLWWTNGCALNETVFYSNGSTSYFYLLGTGGDQVPVCATVLTIDGTGSIYFYDSASGDVVRFVPNGSNGYTEQGIYNFNYQSGQLPHAVSDIAVDSNFNVYLTYQDGTQMVEMVYHTSANGPYWTQTNPIANITVPNGDTAQNTVAVDQSGSIYIGAKYDIWKYVPNSSGSYNIQQFTQYGSYGTSSSFSSVRLDSFGDVSFYATGTPSVISHYGNGAATGAGFGSVNNGSVSGPTTLRLNNIGTVEMGPFNAVHLPSSFSQVTGYVSPYVGINSGVDCGPNIGVAPGDHCNLSIDFAPVNPSSGTITGTADLTLAGGSGLEVEPNSQLTLTGVAVHATPSISAVAPASGAAAGGTAVVLTGSAFSDATSVTFTTGSSTNSASFMINSNTQLTVTSPAGTAGASSVINVINPGGTTGLTNPNYSYNQAVSAAKSTLVLSPLSVSQGSNATLTATVKDSSGNPVPNAAVTFTTSNAQVSPAPVLTYANASGVAVVDVEGSYPGTTVFTARADGVALTQTPTFTVKNTATAVGTTVTGLTVAVTVATAGTLANSQALYLGAAGQDFTYTSDTCANGSVSVGTVCTVKYAFSPKGPGLRQGAALLKDSSGNVLGYTPINGIATGPLPVYSPRLQSSVVNKGSSWVVVDGAGNIYTCDGSSEIDKTSGGVTTAVLSGISPRPVGIALDGAGNLFYATFNGFLYELVGGTGSPKSLGPLPDYYQPLGQMAVDSSGNVYIPTASGVVKAVVGTFASSVVVPVTGGVNSVAFDAAGDMFYSDKATTNISKIPAGSTTATVIFTGQAYPFTGLAVDAAGDVYAIAFEQGVRIAAGTLSATNLPLPQNIESIWIDGGGTLYVAAQSYVIALGTSAGTVSFTANVGTNAAEQMVTLENDGNTALTVTGLQTAAPFLFDSANSTCTASTSLAVSSYCTFSIGYLPSTATASIGALTVTDNRLNVSGSTQPIPLIGTGTSTQLITFPRPLSPVSVGDRLTLTATASSGLPVAYSASGPATLSGSTLLYNGVGTVVITASQAGNTAYSAAAPVSQTVVVNSASGLVGVSSGTETVTLTIATAGTLGAINVVTQGLPNLDYKPVSGDTDANACAIGTNYAANATCTVEYTFTPTTPGSRLGGVILLSNGSTPVLMSKSLLSGSGIGPMALFQAGSPAVHLSTSLNTPRGLTVDAAGDVFLTDMDTKQILKFAAGATTPTVLANTSGTPAATAVDGAGDVFYTTSTGIYEIPLGSGTPVAVTTSITNADNNLSVDGAGNLYLTDLSGHIYKVTAGTYGFSEFNFNPPTAERFAGMALDANGNLFAADFNGNTLYEVPAGTFGINTIYTGSPLANPESVTVDSAGNIYVSNSLQTYIYRFSAQNYAAAPVQLSLPAQHALAIGPNGALYAVYQSMLNEYPRTSGTPASFPAVNEGSNGTPQNFVLENDGNANLNISSVATGSTSFPLGTQTASTGSTPLTVLPAGTVSIPVNYVPQTTAPTGILTVTDNSLNQTSATQTTGLYGSGIPTATKLAFSVAPATPLTAGGNAGTVQVSLVDPSGNITTSSSVAVALNVTGPAGYTHTYSANASNSVATFSLVAVPLNAAGTYTYTATSGTLTAAQATESVSSGAVSSLILTGLTTFAAPSISESATVSAVDVYGNVVPSFSGTVTLTSSDKLAVLNPVSYTYLASDAGVKTFVVTLKTAGTQKITATSGALTVSTSVLVKQAVWVLNGNQTLARLDGNGSQTTTAGTAAASSTRAGIAFDNNGDVWLASSTNGLLEYSVTGAHITVSGSSAAGVSAPTSVAVDGAGQIWVVNAGNKSVSVLSSTGGAVSPSTGLQPGTLNVPTGLAIDSAGSVWVTNSGSNTVTKIIGAAAPVVSPTVTGAANNQLGVRP